MEQRRAGRPARPPRFKKKGRCVDRFHLANDKFRLDGKSAVLPKVGRVALREALRWPGRILGASVAREADHWFISILVEVPDQDAQRRLRIRSRRLSRKVNATKTAAGIEGRIPKGTRLPVSNNQTKDARALARLQASIARVRRDFTPMLTTRLCRENQAVVIEVLHVSGMLANARLAHAIADIGF